MTVLALALTLQFVDAIEPNGNATALWLEIVARRHPENVDAARVAKPMTDAERAWRDRIRSRVEAWPREVPALQRNFDAIEAPGARIVIGNRGGQDAFTHDAATIVFDVSRLQAEYGDASQPENAERIDRFFRHEYTHLLQKAWLAKHPYDARTPLELALLEIWKEGLGHYFSLSPKWQNRSNAAVAALRELEPRLVARLSALSTATDATSLMADLSNGRFDQKWGALTVALWLEEDARRSPDALRDFVAAGPAGFWTLADKHLSAELRAVLREVRAGASIGMPAERADSLRREWAVRATLLVCHGTQPFAELRDDLRHLVTAELSGQLARQGFEAGHD